jgi:hypothetical protein
MEQYRTRLKNLARDRAEADREVSKPPLAETDREVKDIRRELSRVENIQGRPRRSRGMAGKAAGTLRVPLFPSTMP